MEVRKRSRSRSSGTHAADTPSSKLVPYSYRHAAVQRQQPTTLLDSMMSDVISGAGAVDLPAAEIEGYAKSCPYSIVLERDTLRFENEKLVSMLSDPQQNDRCVSAVYLPDGSLVRVILSAIRDAERGYGHMIIGVRMKIVVTDPRVHNRVVDEVTFPVRKYVGLDPNLPSDFIRVLLPDPQSYLLVLVFDRTERLSRRAVFDTPFFLVDLSAGKRGEPLSARVRKFELNEAILNENSNVVSGTSSSPLRNLVLSSLSSPLRARSASSHFVHPAFGILTSSRRNCIGICDTYVPARLSDEARVLYALSIRIDDFESAPVVACELAVLVMRREHGRSHTHVLGSPDQVGAFVQSRLEAVRSNQQASASGRMQPVGSTPRGLEAGLRLETATRTSERVAASPRDPSADATAGYADPDPDPDAVPTIKVVSVSYDMNTGKVTSDTSRKEYARVTYCQHEDELAPVDLQFMEARGLFVVHTKPGILLCPIQRQDTDFAQQLTYVVTTLSLQTHVNSPEYQAFMPAGAHDTQLRFDPHNFADGWYGVRCAQLSGDTTSRMCQFKMYHGLTSEHADFETRALFVANYKILPGTEVIASAVANRNDVRTFPALSRSRYMPSVYEDDVSVMSFDFSKCLHSLLVTKISKITRRVSFLDTEHTYQLSTARLGVDAMSGAFNSVTQQYSRSQKGIDVFKYVTTAVYPRAQGDAYVSHMRPVIEITVNIPDRHSFQGFKTDADVNKVTLFLNDRSVRALGHMLLRPSTRHTAVFRPRIVETSGHQQVNFTVPDGTMPVYVVLRDQDTRAFVYHVLFPTEEDKHMVSRSATAAATDADADASVVSDPKRVRAGGFATAPGARAFLERRAQRAQQRLHEMLQHKARGLSFTNPGRMWDAQDDDEVARLRAMTSQ